jgi:hypothetical protein
MYQFELNGRTCKCDTVDELLAATAQQINEAAQLQTDRQPNGNRSTAGPAEMSRRWAIVDRFIDSQGGLRARQTRTQIYRRLRQEGAFGR